MQISFPRCALAGALLAAPLLVNAEQLGDETVRAWQQYLNGAQARMQSRLDPSGTFMWLDDQPGRRVQVKQGKILVAPVALPGGQPVPNGLIHDWIGAAFIPNTTIQQFHAVIDDYNQYQQIYRPTVVASHTISRSGGADSYAMRLLHKTTFLSWAVDTQDRVQTFPLDADRAYAISQSLSIREIRNYGKPDEYELSPGQGDGLIWRLCSISRYQERDGGVYVELEVIALTRDIPASLHWLVAPLVAKMSRNSLLASLTQTRSAVCSHQGAVTLAQSPVTLAESIR